jgi:prepilin-type N-terminal cleavage/methylation domain-containing protein
MQGKGNERGFTLVELIVSVAIFTIIMSGIAAVFVASLNAVNTGYQIAEANEESRIAFNLIERDLSTAFTSRDYGDYYQFYGTPVGFSLVGLVRSYETYSASPNIARVTYVLHQTEGMNLVTNAEDEDEAQLTYALLRYYEPNEQDLDSFPVDWEFYRTGDWAGGVIDQELEAVEGLVNDGWPPSVVEQMIKAKKRQLWIRILSGSEYVETAPETGLPQFWADTDEQGLKADPDDDRPNPWDYMLAQNIAAGRPPGLGGEDPDPDDGDYDYPDEDNDKAYDYGTDQANVFFEYGLTDSARMVLTPFWNADYNIPGNRQFVEGAAGPGVALDLTDPLFAYPSDPTSPEWSDPSRIPPPSAAEPDPIWRALPDGAEGDPLLRSPLVAHLGTPINPRLPEVARLNIRLLYERPYPGAPDAERLISTVIDVPTGYMQTAAADEN